MPLPYSWTHDDILGLSLVPRMKAVVLRRFVERFFSLEHLLEENPTELASIGIVRGSLFPTRVQENVRSVAAQQAEQCHSNNIRTVTFWDDEYPPYLREIYYPPVVLYVRGALQKPDAATLAIVGTRHCTDYGKITAERYADYFARAGIVVVSGLAMGIDTIAHKAVLAAHGVTYAVIASGIDKISSSYARQVADGASERGAVVSEYPCGTAALPAYFPQRNRIISGIARAVVVVESGEKGGSLITAQFALDQNRELFAVPGRIISDKSRGTNLLIKRSSAHLTLEPQDVLETLGWGAHKPAQNAQMLFREPLNPREQNIYDRLSLEPLHIDELAEQAAVLVHELLVTLLELEFKGIVRQLPGKQFIKAQ